MKKLAFLLTAVLVIASNFYVSAQSSSGTTPAPGTTHTYSVTSPGPNFEWTIYKGSVDPGNIVDAADAGIASVSGANTSELTIEWAAVADEIGTEYLIVVVEEDAEGCTNSKALPVVITSVFDLVASTNTPNACYDEDVTVSWSGGQAKSDVTYNHGTAIHVYKVTPTGVGASETWKFEPSFDFAAGFSQSSLTVSGAVSGAVTADGNGDYSFTGTETVTVTLVVDNANTYNNDSAPNAQDYSLTMTLNDVTVSSNAIETDGTNNTAIVSVSRPNTSAISAN